MFKLDFKQAEEPEIKLTTSTGSSKKEENSIKSSTFTSMTTGKTIALTRWFFVSKVMSLLKYTV